MRDTFLFDLDGTLVTMELDFARIRKDVDSILGERGFPEELLDSSVSTLEIMRRAVDYFKKNGMDWEALKEETDLYLEKVEMEAASIAVPIEGTEDILKILQQKKKKIGVITRNNRRVALNVLKKCRIDQYVDLVLARDDVDNVKPHPDHVLAAIKRLGTSPERTVVLGDHHFEIEAGNKAGCFTIGVLTGSGTRATLKEARLILDSIGDLKDVLPKLEQ